MLPAYVSDYNFGSIFFILKGVLNLQPTHVRCLVELLDLHVDEYSCF